MKNHNQATDKELVQQSLQEPAAYSQIFNRYYMPLSKFVKRLGCRNNNDTQDILQEIFISAYMNLRDYDADLKFSSWIYRIAHNKTISFFRRQNVRPQIIETNDQILFMEMIADDVDLTADTDKKYLRNEIKSVFEKIDIKYRDPLIIKFLEDKSYSEISDILRVPISTVGTLINRGKQKFKDILRNNNRKKILFIDNLILIYSRTPFFGGLAFLILSLDFKTRVNNYLQKIKFAELFFLHQFLTRIAIQS